MLKRLPILVQVAADSSRFQEIERWAKIIGPFAVHQPASIASRGGGPFRFNPGWTVTHISSRRSVSGHPPCCFLHAKQLAGALIDSGIDWSFGQLPSKREGLGLAADFPASMRESMARAESIYRSLLVLWRDCPARKGRTPETPKSCVEQSAGERLCRKETGYSNGLKN